MSDWLNKLTSEHIRTLSPYQSARRLFSASEGEQQLWLNANESPEASPASIDYHVFNRYPDCQPKDLIQAYATYAGVDPQQVIATRGADEGIELLIRAFCQANKDNILICPPTYGMYSISAETFAVGVKKVPLNDDFSLDITGIEKVVNDVNLVFLCSPNNPTGTLLAQSQINDVLDLCRDKAIVVVDEAYIEFCAEHNVSKLLANNPHLVILRTLSKAFALAGIRCGFTIADNAVIETLLKVIAPYPVPAPVAQVALQSLSPSGVENMRKRTEMLKSELQQLSGALSAIDGINIVGDTFANFVLFKHRKSADIMKYLIENNLFIRDQSKQVYLENCLRVTIGSPSQNAHFMALMDRYLNNSDLGKEL
ncbi:MAG: histidinol-phosphate transaminase [Pseudomonadota bacterium]